MNILMVGEHPYAFTGNSHMMSAMLKQIDHSKHSVIVYANSRGYAAGFTHKFPCQIIEGGFNNDADYYGANGLITTLNEIPDIELVIFVGLDLWVYANVMKHIVDIKKRRKFLIASVFPWDIYGIRKDWLEWLKPIDFPCVYSQYGHMMLKGLVRNIRYFRPTMEDWEMFKPLDSEVKKAIRKKMFPTVSDDTIIFGSFIANQYRKDPQRLIRAFARAKRMQPNMCLYLHTEMNHPAGYNLPQYIKDCGLTEYDVFSKAQNKAYNTAGMVESYNMVDCYVNCSLQEGLNWTIVEAMLCGLPILCTRNSAQTELVDGVGIGVNCVEITYLPIMTESGQSWIETYAADSNELIKHMVAVASGDWNLKQLSERSLKKGSEWVNGMNNVNEIINEASIRYNTRTVTPKKKAILFMQHSSAGDVLMSTQCFKGLIKKHNMPIVYMTQKQFMDIVEGNPNVERVIEWDPYAAQDYTFVYDPHGEKILPGGWNNLDVKLYNMYPYFCGVPSDEMFIGQKEVDAELPDEYYIVHTTGGQAEYRTYSHMDVVIKRLGGYAIQIGGKNDLACKEAHIDLRGKLSFRETAWVMAKAKGAIVIDSFPAHLAGALGTPVVVLFGPAPARVTAPRAKAGRLVCLEPNKLDVCPITSNCWGSLEHVKCTTPCIDTINPLTVARKFKDLILEMEHDNLNEMS